MLQCHQVTKLQSCNVVMLKCHNVAMWQSCKVVMLGCQGAPAHPDFENFSLPQGDIALGGAEAEGERHHLRGHVDCCQGIPAHPDYQHFAFLRAILLWVGPHYDLK